MAQIERHMPSLLNVETATTPPTMEMPAVQMAGVSTLSRLRFGRRLRRLRRAA